MADYNGVITSIELGHKLQAIDPNTMPYKQQPYQSKVGSLMYTIISTWPDLGYAVSMLSQFHSNSAISHHDAIKRMLHYSKSTMSYGITYRSQDTLGISGYCKIPNMLGYSDSDWAGNKDTPKFTSSYIFLLNGGVVS